MRRFVEYGGTWSGNRVTWSMDEGESFSVFTHGVSPEPTNVRVVLVGDDERPSEPIGIAVMHGGSVVELRDHVPGFGGAR